MDSVVDTLKEHGRESFQNDKKYIDLGKSQERLQRRKIVNIVAQSMFSLTIIFIIFVLGLLLFNIIKSSIGWLDWEFLTGRLSINPAKAGIKSVIMGSFMLMVVVAPVTMVIGVATAIFLEEYAKKGTLHSIISLNISNLAGVPSVIFGLLGLTVFGRMFGLGSSILAGGLTLSLLVLPNVVVSSQEAIKAVPNYLREASYGLGATKWTTIRKIVLPSAIPGIMTGSILALSRAIGETAPLVVLGIPTLILKSPESFMDDFTALPIQIYYWTLDTVLTREYANLAAATIVILLVVLFLLNASAIIIRNKFQRRN
ncbi:phosphate ABC transporter permease PstA [Petrocella sp. FN5]|uniref:phosphate ABC transporter permease PstA n=1 Tax=Petrocella sp. FN5 TaxID=3032002 RepID=UPI002ED1AC62